MWQDEVPPSVILQAIDYRRRCMDGLEDGWRDSWGSSKDNKYDFNVWVDDSLTETVKKEACGVTIYRVIYTDGLKYGECDTSSWKTVIYPKRGAPLNRVRGTNYV